MRAGLVKKVGQVEQGVSGGEKLQEFLQGKTLNLERFRRVLSLPLSEMKAQQPPVYL